MADNSVYVGAGPQGGDDAGPSGKKEPDENRNYVSLPEGTKLDSRYEIVREIGSGGFGIVYEVRDVASGDEIVAIKEYFPDDIGTRDGSSVAAKRPDFSGAFDEGRKAFVEEARLLRRLEHPNIVRVYYWFSANRTVYLVMKRLRGHTLQTVIERREKPDTATVIAWLRQALDALAAVHKQGLLHRDVGPRNIFLDESGGLQLIDFGAARMSVGRITKRLTAIANPGYTPPEQYDESGAMDQTPASDFYALGATFYHLVTGSKPMPSKGRELNDRVLPAAQVARGNYPNEILATIDKAMQMQSSKRWQRAEDWLAALESKTPKKLKLKSIRGWIAATLSVLWLLLVSVSILDSLRAETRDLRRALQALKDSPPTLIGSGSITTAASIEECRDRSKNILLKMGLTVVQATNGLSFFGSSPGCNVLAICLSHGNDRTVMAYSTCVPHRDPEPLGDSFIRLFEEAEK